MSRLFFFLFVSLAGNVRAAELIRGSVVDPDDRPVAGALVRLISLAGSAIAEAQTDQNGDFEIAAPAARAFHLAVRGAGFAEARRQVVLPGAEAVRIVFAPAGTQVEVTVTASRGFLERPGAAEAMVEARDAEWFRAHPLPTIGHTLEASPGILLQQTSPSQVSPFLRGLTGYQVLNLVDGVRFNNATFRSGPNQYLAFLEPSQAQRIESALGPSSAQYGSDSLGGTIQVLTREASFASSAGPDLHGEWNVFGASADVSGGSDLHLAAAGSRLAWTGGVSGRKHNDLRAGGGNDSRHVLRRFFGLGAGRAAELTGPRQQDTGVAQWASTASWRHGSARTSR